MVKLPTFFDPVNAKNWNHEPDLGLLLDTSADWVSENSLKPAVSDNKRVLHWHIDEQKDFMLPEGTLFVAGRSGTGAVDDAIRIAEFMYKNMDIITAHEFTLDTHNPYQIFSRAFWRMEDGSIPEPFTLITEESIKKGEIRPLPAVAQMFFSGNYPGLLSYVQHYCRELENQGKYVLILWTEHCILGQQGHNLSGLIQEARMFHAYSRYSANYCTTKGTHPVSERYSPIREEVMTMPDGSPLPGAQRSVDFLKKGMEYDYIIVSGEAGSHCLPAFTLDMIEDIQKQDPELAQKFYILTDCTSAVTIPDGNGGFVQDYTNSMHESFEKYENAGMHLVKSTDPVDTWPDFIL